MHLYLSEAKGSGTLAGLPALDIIEKLQPSTVVASHKRDGDADSPDDIGRTRRYIEDFTAEPGRLAVSPNSTRPTRSPATPGRVNRGVLWNAAKFLHVLSRPRVRARTPTTRPIQNEQAPREAQYDAVCTLGGPPITRGCSGSAACQTARCSVANGDSDPMTLPHYSYLLAGLRIPAGPGEDLPRLRARVLVPAPRRVRRRRRGLPGRRQLSTGGISSADHRAAQMALIGSAVIRSPRQNMWGPVWKTTPPMNWSPRSSRIQARCLASAGVTELLASTSKPSTRSPLSSATMSTLRRPSVSRRW